MCSQRVKCIKQKINKIKTTNARLNENERMKVDESIMENLVEKATGANKTSNISCVPNNRIPVTKPSSDASQLYKNGLSLTLLTMLYFVFSLPAPGLIEAAPVPETNACGYALAYDGANEQLDNTTLGRAEKRVVLCQLHGNLTKQIRSLKPYKAPKDFSVVWGKHNIYKFLKIARRKNVTLVTWHKQLQVYALTVRYLLDRAINYKNLQSTIIHANKSVKQADIDLQRLQHLNNTIRGILCDLEMTAYILKGPGRNTTIDVITADTNILPKSEKRLAEEGVDQVDIDMVYYRFRKTILNMRKIINEKRKCVRDGKSLKKSLVDKATEQMTTGLKVKRMRKE